MPPLKSAFQGLTRSLSTTFKRGRKKVELDIHLPSPFVDFPDRVASSTRSPKRSIGKSFGSRRRRGRITFVTDSEGRRNLRLTRKKKVKSPDETITPNSPILLSRGTSWVTTSTAMSPEMSPKSLSPRSAHIPIPVLEMELETPSSTTVVNTPSPTPPIKEETPSQPACLLERLFPPHELERRPSSTKMPAPGRVYVFDVLSAESPTERTERRSSQPPLPPLVFRSRPWTRIGDDLVFLISHMPLVPRLFVPCRRHIRNEYHASTAQGVLLVLSMAVSVLGLASLCAALPAVAALGLLILLAETLQGPPTRKSSRPDVDSVPGAEREAWFFINGVAASGTGTQEAIDHLHGLVRRPITALMNRSLGLWFDFLQSVLQRNLSLPTKDVRFGYKRVHEAVINSALDRVVIVAHSQGGIFASAWADQLIVDLPPALLSRVEVYTFGSAASHFALRAYGGETEDGVFGRIEHFANMHDMVAQFGVLQHARGGGFAPSREGEEVKAVYGRYVGRVFARNRTGHMLLDHYLHHNDSILDEESVRQSSKFAAYVGGGVPLRHDSRASAMSKGSKPTSARAFANSVRKERKDGKIQLGVGLPGQ